MIKVQASISGYGGQPATVFSAYDETSGILAVSVESSYRQDRVGDCMVIANSAGVPCDSHFHEKDLPAAIDAYYAMRNGVSTDGLSTRLSFGDRAVRTNPDSAIEFDAMNESGKKFRVNANITNAQLAVLATCLYAVRAGEIQDTVVMTETMLDILRGNSVLMTI